MKHTIAALIPAFACLVATRAWSGEILQPQVIGALSILDQNPGQTFTAVDPRISTIGFNVYAATHHSPTTVLSYELRLGSGSSGTLLASNSITLGTSFSGYADVNFSSVTLTVGQVYTVVATEPTGDFQVRFNQFADVNGPIPGRHDYTGGFEIGSCLASPFADLTFRIEPIPEPRWSLFMLAGAFVFRLRRGCRVCV